MPRRKLLIVVLLLVAVATAGVVVYERAARPARSVLLLPDGDLLLYADLAPLPFVNVAQFINVDQLPGQSDPQYQDFLRQTNFHADRDLASIAVSVRNTGDPNPESSAVFTGQFDQNRLQAYLQKLSTETESYGGKTIFSIRREDHTVRACIVDSKRVAITNMNSPEAMHSIIDKSRGISLLGGDSSLIRDYYRYVPLGSLAWGMVRVPPQGSGSQFPGGINLNFLQNAVSVISVRYTGSVRIKAEIMSANQADAASVREAVNLFLVMGRGAAQSLSPAGPDKDVKAVFDNIQVQDNGTRTAINVVIPQEVVKKFAEKMSR